MRGDERQFGESARNVAETCGLDRVSIMEDRFMKRRALLAATFAVLAGIFSANPVQAQSWADPMFSELNHNWGPVARGATVRYPFRMTNTTNEPINIVSLRPSCGCTSGASDKSIVAPGDTATIEARMDTTNFVGHKATILFVTLITASGRQAEVRLAVSSDIQSDIVLNPGTIDFGYVVAGQEVTRTLRIDRVGSPEWRAMKMTSNVRGIDAKLAETARTSTGVSYELTVSLRKDAPEGVIRNDLFVHTNDPNNPAIPVLMTAQVVGALNVSPKAVPFGTMKASATQPTIGKFVIKGNAPFVVTGVEGSEEGIELIVAETQPKTVHVMTVQITPGKSAIKGAFQKTLKVHTNLPGQPPAEVVLQGTVNE
ncbi:DUF1573 domain-containing protein [bacterium]|nr:DUF1573 domain-containing protein [bacterium]